jgi:hypothetical protein
MRKPANLKLHAMASAMLLASCAGGWAEERHGGQAAAEDASGLAIKAPAKVQQPGKRPRGLASATANPVEDVRKSLRMVIDVLRKGDGVELFTQCYSPRFVGAMEQLDAMKRLRERFAEPDPSALSRFREGFEKALAAEVTFNDKKDQATVHAPEGMDPLYLSRVNGRWYLDLTHGDYTPTLLMTLF